MRTLSLFALGAAALGAVALSGPAALAAGSDYPSDQADHIANGRYQAVLGDCAACPWPGHPGPVPPRAQAAQQQAAHMLGQIARRLDGMALTDWRYRDFGSLVSLGDYSTVGNMMGFLIGRSIFIEGLFARIMYRSLYAMHQRALHGNWRAVAGWLARGLSRRTGPAVKLH